MATDMKAELARRTAEVNSIIEGFLPEETGMQKTVLQAMNYSVRAGGKRIRPILMQETHRLFGGHSGALPSFMAAIEMVHTYSLVHDDLPAMDNDRFRRGKETTWAVYGEGMGVLAGDALLNYAFEIAADAVVQYPEVPAAARALRILAKKSGAGGLIGGQAVDVEMEGKEISILKMEFIHGKKTCALIEAAMLIGAVLGGATPAEQAMVEESAHALGMAFQIRDDILDVVGDAKKLGKPVGSDEKNRKQTYVSLVGLEASRAEVKQQTTIAVESLRHTGRENPFLVDLMYYLADRES